MQDHDTPEAQLDLAEGKKQLAWAVSKLGAKARRTVILVDYIGVLANEVAEMDGVTEGAISIRRRTAKDRIRTSIKKAPAAKDITKADLAGFVAEIKREREAYNQFLTEQAAKDAEEAAA